MLFVKTFMKPAFLGATQWDHRNEKRLAEIRADEHFCLFGMVDCKGTPPTKKIVFFRALLKRKLFFLGGVPLVCSFISFCWIVCIILRSSNLEKRLADLCGGRAAEQTLFFSHGSLLHLDRPPLIFNQCHFLSTPQSRLLSVQNEDILQQKSSRRNNHR